jgi:hypothetical protein
LSSTQYYFGIALPGLKIEGQKLRRLTVAKGDSSLGEVVGGQLHSDTVAGQDADAVAAQSASQVSQHNTIMFQLYAEQSAGKLLQDNSGYFNIVFFTHSTSLLPGKPVIGVTGLPGAF